MEQSTRRYCNKPHCVEVPTHTCHDCGEPCCNDHSDTYCCYTYCEECLEEILCSTGEICLND